MLSITFYIYSPGLLGGYVFDDATNILENNKLKIDNINLESLLSALGSGGAGPLGRPISMLSFALNYYFTGFDPFYFKLTNLFIHLINGFLVFVFSYFIIQRLNCKNNIKKDLVKYAALIISFIWLVHPINLTSVLYVVQRMTSLSTLFGFLALAVYCYWRNRNQRSTISTLFIFFGVIFFLGCSILSKESGILFFGLLYWIELLIYQGKNKNYNDIYLGKYKLIQILRAGVFFGIILFIMIANYFISNGDVGNRNFNNFERLLTECRVVVYYLKMIFVPMLTDLSLYHDDFTVSHSILKPITTIYSIILLVIITISSLFFYNKNPLILFAWGWFLISQLLESTFISLELVHEHRNYFGSIGFIILAAYSLIKLKKMKVKLILSVILSIYSLNLMFITWQRSVIWSNLVDHAAYEVTMHPRSDRANYQMARIYMKLMNEIPTQRVLYAEKAYYFLEQSKKSYMPSNGAWFGELHLSSEMKWPINDKVINELKFRLSHLAFLNNNIGFLKAFSDCQIQGYCAVPHEQAVMILAAGIGNPNANDSVKSELYKLLANYFISIISDFRKAEEFMNEAIKLKKDANGYLVFSQIYRLENKFDLAQQKLNEAKRVDVNNIWYAEIKSEQINIDNAKKNERNVNAN